MCFKCETGLDHPTDVCANPKKFAQSSRAMESRAMESRAMESMGAVKTAGNDNIMEIMY
jgi:hypothetical protein